MIALPGPAPRPLTGAHAREPARGPTLGPARRSGVAETWIHLRRFAASAVHRDAAAARFESRMHDLWEDYSERELRLLADFAARAADVAELCAEEAVMAETGRPPS